MRTTRRADGRTTTQILELEARHGYEADPGECRDPECPEWGPDGVEAFWRHFHEASAC